MLKKSAFSTTVPSRYSTMVMQYSMGLNDGIAGPFYEALTSEFIIPRYHMAVQSNYNCFVEQAIIVHKDLFRSAEQLM